ILSSLASAHHASNAGAAPMSLPFAGTCGKNAGCSASWCALHLWLSHLRLAPRGRIRAPPDFRRTPRVTRNLAYPRANPRLEATMDKFKVFRIRGEGGNVQAGFVACTLDELDPGEVVVRVSYSTINYKDALAATGKGRILLRPTCIGGIDLAGTVI